MIAALAHLPIDLILAVSDYNSSRSLSQTTAVSLLYEGEQAVPTDTFAIDQTHASPLQDGLEWMALAKEGLPHARPMTTEERTSINAFFWSHFK